MISGFINTLFEKVKNQHTTILGWSLSFLGILFVRFIFESLSSPPASGIIPSDPYTIVHYILFFLCLTLGSSVILGYFTKDYISAPKILLFGLPLLWLAPFVDILVSHGVGFRMSYIFDSGKNLIFDFFTFFGPALSRGATYGIRFGIAIALFGLGFYIWLSTKNKTKTFVGVVSLYVLIFFVAALPGFFYTFTHITNSSSTNAQVVSYLQQAILKSTISHNTLREGVSSVTPARFLDLTFDKLLSQILFILSCLFGAILFLKINSKKFWAVVKNMRPERVNFYTISLCCGIGFAYINNLGNRFTFLDVFGVICLVLAWMSLWMNAVHINDIADIEIDKISNKERPLVKKELTEKDMKEFGNIWLIIALLGAWSAGFYPFFMALVYIACSYIYSAPPMRLRQYPLVPSFLIATAALSTILSGFFFISVNKQIGQFPILLAVGILIMVTLAINFKDVKDIEGDKANGIMTLPVLFGKRGVKIVGLLFALSILLIPVFLSFYLLYFICIPSAIIGYRIIIKKPYREKPVFILRFVLLSGIAISYVVVYWLAHAYHFL